MLIIMGKLLDMYAQLIPLMTDAPKGFIHVNDALDSQLAKIGHVGVSDHVSHLVRRPLHKEREEWGVNLSLICIEEGIALS